MQVICHAFEGILPDVREEEVEFAVFQVLHIRKGVSLYDVDFLRVVELWKQRFLEEIDDSLLPLNYRHIGHVLFEVDHIGVIAQTQPEGQNLSGGFSDRLLHGHDLIGRDAHPAPVAFVEAGIGERAVEDSQSVDARVPFLYRLLVKKQLTVQKLSIFKSESPFFEADCPDPAEIGVFLQLLRVIDSEIPLHTAQESREPFVPDPYAAGYYDERHSFLGRNLQDPGNPVGRLLQVGLIMRDDQAPPDTLGDPEVLFLLLGDLVSHGKQFPAHFVSLTNDHGGSPLFYSEPVYVS